MTKFSISVVNQAKTDRLLGKTSVKDNPYKKFHVESRSQVNGSGASKVRYQSRALIGDSWEIG